MKNLEDFCGDRGIGDNIKEAFLAYLRSDYARKYELRNGETVKLIVGKMTSNELLEAWESFVKEMINYLPREI